MASSIKKLRKSYPHPLELNEQLNALQDRSDREVAILGASYLDTALEFALKDHFAELELSQLELPQIDVKDLFGINGLLGGFSIKILMGYALKFLSQGLRSDLIRIKNIRDLFAHSILPLDFGMNEIANECNFSILENYLLEFQNLTEKRADIKQSEFDEMILTHPDGSIVTIKDHLLISDSYDSAIFYVPMPSKQPNQTSKEKFISAVQISWMILMCNGHASFFKNTFKET